MEVSEVCRLSFLWIWIWPTWTWHKKSSHTAMQTCSMQPCTILETCRWVERYIYYNNIIYEKEKGEDDDMMICFPPTGYPPRNTAAGTAHSTHSTQPALPPPHTPRYPQSSRIPLLRRRADAPAPLKRSMLDARCSPLSEMESVSMGAWGFPEKNY